MCTYARGYMCIGRNFKETGSSFSSSSSYLTSSVKVPFLFNCSALLFVLLYIYFLFFYRMPGSPGVEAYVYICNRNRPSRSYDA